jgi:hypothetical protein
MAPDDPQKIREIKHSFNFTETNKYLAAGWEYLTTVVRGEDIVTVLGWKKLGSINHPVPTDVHLA